MSETKTQEVKNVDNTVMNIKDIKVRQVLDLKEVVSERQNRRNAYLEQIAEHLVYDVPTRSVKGGPFNTVTRVEYHAIDDDEWHQLEMKRAKVFDSARMQAMTIDEYKKNGLPVPSNFSTLSADYYKNQDALSDSLLKMFLNKTREEIKLCDQRFITDICEAFELKHRLGLVNFQEHPSNSGSTYS